MMRPLVLLLALVLASGPVSALTALVYARIDAEQMERVRVLARIWDQVWIDRDLEPGDAWRQEIAERICTADRVLVLWSTAAAASPEVAAEWRLAMACGRVVVPVMLDDAPLPPDLGARQGVDWR